MPKPIPSVNEFVWNPKYDSALNVRVELGRFLNDAFHGSLAPLLLMTSAEALGVRELGQNRHKRIVDLLGKNGLEFRSPHLAVTERARKLYGKLKNVPVQALMLKIKSPHDRVVLVDNDRNIAVQEIVVLQQDATLGQFLASKKASTEEQLRRFIADHNTTLSPNDFKQVLEQLSDSLAPWQTLHDYIVAHPHR